MPRGMESPGFSRGGGSQGNRFHQPGHDPPSHGVFHDPSLHGFTAAEVGDGGGHEPDKPNHCPPQRPVREKQAERKHHGRRMVGVPSNARIQGRMVRATAHNHRQVLSEHANLLPLRGEDRAEKACPASKSGHGRARTAEQPMTGIRTQPKTSSPQGLRSASARTAEPEPRSRISVPSFPVLS